MISFLKGKIFSKTSNEVIIDVNGVGYGVHISMLTSEKLGAIGEIAELLIIMVIQQEFVNLYGFAEGSEKEVFKLLISVPNVGYKTALSILSSLTPIDIRNCIVSGNLLMLQKLPGIGKKTAERMLVELRDKMTKFNIEGDTTQLDGDMHSVKSEAIAALVSLGYSRLIAEKAVAKVIQENPDTKLSVELMIKKSLGIVLKI